MPPAARMESPAIASETSKKRLLPLLTFRLGVCTGCFGTNEVGMPGESTTDFSIRHISSVRVRGYTQNVRLGSFFELAQCHSHRNGEFGTNLFKDRAHEGRSLCLPERIGKSHFKREEFFRIGHQLARDAAAARKHNH